MPRIVVIEDDPLISDSVVEVLQNAGYEVLAASDGVRGLKLALSEDPHLVLLDIMLPEIDGWEVCKAIRAESTVPIVMATALNEEVDRILGLELGADDYLTKPFSLDELRDAVKAGLQKKALHDQRLNQRMNELRNNITTALPHELRTVVMVLEGYLQVMMDGRPM